MPTPRSDLGVAAVNGEIYAIGGLGNGTGALNTNEEYDPATNTWTTKTPMPTARYDFAIAAYQGKIYCISGIVNETISPGGESLSYVFSNATEVYDPATDNWTTKASIPSPGGGLEPSVVDDKIYLLGGTVLYAYDPATDSWATKTQIPIVSAAAASAGSDDKIYSFGGEYVSDFVNGTQLGGYVSLTEIYDPALDSWSSGSGPPTYFTFDSVAASTSGIMAPKRVYVFDVPYADLSVMKPPFYYTQIYDPANDSWVTGADMPTQLYSYGVAVVNDLFYLIGGQIIIGYSTEMTSAFGMPIYETVGLNEQYTPLGYGTVPSAVSLVSPENHQTYTANDVPLTFTVNSQFAPITQLSYSMDQNSSVEISGNTTLTGLSSGNHTLTVYAADSNGNIASQTVTFTVMEPSTPTPTQTPTPAATPNGMTISQTDTYLIATVVVVAIAAGAVLAAYRLRRKQKTAVEISAHAC